jgi:hypothetical protein
MISLYGLQSALRVMGLKPKGASVGVGVGVLLDVGVVDGVEVAVSEGV